jgi:NAD(P)H-hydrate epimerase
MALPSWLSPIYDADEMRASDAWAISDRGVPSLELMEAAGSALAAHTGELAEPGPVRVVCGKGNNAGDGFVAARLLRDSGYAVEVLLLWPGEELAGDSEANFARVEQLAREVGPRELPEALAGSGVVLDAIFGTGFSGSPRAPADVAIEAMNACGAPIVAADIASGVEAASGEVGGPAVKARATVSFHGAKLGQWIAPGKWHSGEVHTVAIGIPPGAPVEPHAGLIEPEVLALLPTRGARSNKFTSGQVLVVGGSRGLTGAVCMASEAAIRAGAGYATVAVPEELEAIIEVKLTEVMSIGCAGVSGGLGPDAAEAILEAAERAAAVVLGPGMGRSRGASELARTLAQQVTAPLLIDADGLNAHAGGLELLRARAAPTVLTPHAGELGRLLGRSGDEISTARLTSAREAAERGGVIVALKGDDTLVTDGVRVAVNRVASPGLATAGSGDVLSGTIAALLARGLAAFEATCAGVLAHARAGQHAAERVGVSSVIATDVISSLSTGLELDKDLPSPRPM